MSKMILRFDLYILISMVPEARIELATQGFSVLRSTDELLRRILIYFWSRDDMEIIVSKLSFIDVLFFLSFLHFVHLCVIIYSSFLISTAIGSISPRQSSCLSPGLISTCLLQRHCGQWLVYPFPVTEYPQFSQVKFSIVRWNFFTGI